MISRRAKLLLAMGLFGCRAETFGADDGPTLYDAPVVVTPASPWAGSTVQLRSIIFAEGGDELALRLGDLDLVATRQDDSTFALAIPDDLADGEHRLDVTVEGITQPLQLRVAGFRALRDLGVDDQPYLAPWPAQRPEGFIARVRDSLTYVDLATGRQRDLNIPSGSFWVRPGFSYSPGRLWVGNIPDSATIYQVDHRLGVASRQGTFPWSITLDYSFFELSPAVKIVTHTDWMWIWAPDLGYYPLWDISVWESPLIVLSPRGDRATFPARGVREGAADVDLPVINALTGAVAFRVPGHEYADAAAFSGDGEELYVLGRIDREAATRSLLRLDATTGALLAEVSVGQVDQLESSTQVVYDSVRDFLYRIGPDGDDLRLTVYDPGTLEVRASVVAPGGRAACKRAADLDLLSTYAIIAPDHRTLWFVVELCDRFRFNTAVYEFGLPEVF